MVLGIEERCGPYTDVHGSTRPWATLAGNRNKYEWRGNEWNCAADENRLECLVEVSFGASLKRIDSDLNSDWTNLVGEYLCISQRGSWIDVFEDSNVYNEEDRASLRINLRIQRDWAEMTMLCKGLQGMGIENVAWVPPVKESQKWNWKTGSQYHVRSAAEPHPSSKS